MMTNGHSTHASDPLPKSGDGREPFARVPLNLGPCEMPRWMESHDNWILSLPDDLDPNGLRETYERFVNSPCPSADVLSQVAEHPLTPTSVLRELAKPRWRRTHLSLSTNPQLPEDL